MKRSFIFNSRYLKEAEKFGDTLQFELYKAIINYGIRQERPLSMSEELKPAWSRIKRMIDSGAASKEEPILFESEEERAFNEYMKENYPHISNMDRPLTYVEYQKLKSAGRDKKYVDKKIRSLENRKVRGQGCDRLYASAYMTILDWIESDVENRPC